MAEKIAAAIAEFIAAGGVITPTTTVGEIVKAAKAAQTRREVFKLLDEVKAATGSYSRPAAGGQK
jgi:hypothetical protein